MHALTISYYISDYGYGHAARAIALIRAMAEDTEEHSMRLIICGGQRILPFLRWSLDDLAQLKPQYRILDYTEPGYVLQPGSIAADRARLAQRLDDYVEILPALITREQAFLIEEKVDLVLTDISPVPISAADKAGITSVGLSNFTWYTAYEQMLNIEQLRPLYDAYASMDYFVALPGSREPEWGRRGKVTGEFFCREVDKEKAAMLKEQLNPDGSKLLIYFALGMSIEIDDLERLPLWKSPDCLFIVSSHVHVTGENIVKIPDHETESQNYLSICDLIITKPGWSTVSEAIVLNKPLLLLKRTFFAEDEKTVRAIPNGHPHLLITWQHITELTISAELMDRLCQSEQASKAPSRYAHSLVRRIRRLAESNIRI